MKLIYGVVASRSDIINYIDPEIDNSWTTWSDGDYVVHFLYDVERDRMIMHEDNCHGLPLHYTEAFIAGLRRAGVEIEMDYKLIVVDTAQETYHSAKVIAALKAGSWYKLIDIGGF